jgi:cell division protein FtsW
MRKGQLEQQILLLVTLALVAFGLVMVYSATSASAALASGDSSYYLRKQGLYALVGLALLLVLRRSSYRSLRLLSPALVLTSIVLLLAVLVVGQTVNGARRWLQVGPAVFQPSELAKLALLVFVAAYLARRPAPRTLGELVKPLGLVTGVICALILAEPDLGTAIWSSPAFPRACWRRREACAWRSFSPRPGSSPTGARACSASSTPGTTRRAPATSPCRR